MATITQYPDGISVNGTNIPLIDILLDQTPEFEFEVFRNEDGSVNTNVSPCGPQLIVLKYVGISLAEFETLKAHYNLAQGKVNDFSFYHRRKDTLLLGCKYESFEVGQPENTNWNLLTVTLTRFA